MTTSKHPLKVTWDHLRVSRIGYGRVTAPDVTRTALLRDLAVLEGEAFWRMNRRMKPISITVVHTKNFLGERGVAPARVYARAEFTTGKVEILHKVYKLPFENVLAIVRHELGHLADNDFNDPGAEQRADDIAQAATGAKIRYDSHDLQTVGKGRWPRPKYLHR